MQEEKKREINVLLAPLAEPGLSTPPLADVAMHDIVEVAQTDVCVWTNPDQVQNAAFVFVESASSQMTAQPMAARELKPSF